MAAAALSLHCGCTVYRFEPDALISKDSGILRVQFEPPVACNADETNTAFHTRRACDFNEGLVHKGLSMRVLSQFDEAAHLVSQ